MEKRKNKILHFVIIVFQILFLGGIWGFLWWKDFLIFKNLLLLGGGFVWVLLIVHLCLRKLRGKFLKTFYYFWLVGNIVLGSAFGYMALSVHNLTTLLSSEQKPSKTYYQYLITLSQSNITKVEELEQRKIGFVFGDHYQQFTKFLSQKVTDYQAHNFDNISKALNALSQNQIQSLVFGDEHLSKFPDLQLELGKKYRILHQIKRTSLATNSRVNGEDKPFVMYIIGYDSYGAVNNVSRNDVNILAFFHPRSKKVLLISTPRDSYVSMPCMNQTPDKLSHSGNGGLECALSAISQLYDIHIDYYLQLNFTSVREIINLLGGLDIHNERYFNTFKSMSEPENQFEFPPGKLHLNGYQVLSYVRERSFFGDERERGENQKKVIRAIVQKMTSPGMLLHVPELFSKMKPYLQTNLKWETLAQIIKIQQLDDRPWEFQEYSLTGEFGRAFSPLIEGIPLSVFFHYEQSVRQARKIVRNFLQGEDIEADLRLKVSGGNLVNYQFHVELPQEEKESENDNEEKEEKEKDHDNELSE